MKHRFLSLSLAAGLLLLLSSSVVHAVESDVIALTLLVKGGVEIRQDTVEWQPLTFGDVLVSDAQIHTEEDGFTALAFTDDGSQVKIRPNTRLTVSAARQPDNSLVKRITEDVGVLLADIKKRKGSYQVITPTSVASVKGTRFWVRVAEDGGTEVITLDGTVELMNQVSGSVVEVDAGQVATSGVDGEIRVQEIGPETEVPEWTTEAAPPPQGPGPGGEGAGGGAGEGGEAPAGGEETPEGGGPSGGGGPGFSMNGAVGATVIDGETYQFFSLRPEFSIGKVGVGLDLSLYFDADGNLREEDWDEPEDVIDKIYYVRYGRKGDPFYARVGSLDNLTLGYGLIMRRYSNAIEWPQVRRIGMDTQVNVGPVGFEAMVNNFREVSTPGVVGARLTYERRLLLPLVFGGTVVHDGNEFLGAKDDDGDGIPNPFDQFPGKNDRDHIGYLRHLLRPDQVDSLIASGDLPDINNPPPSILDRKEAVTIWGVDIGVPILRGGKVNLWLYGQMAQIDGYGRGYTVPGLSFSMGPFRAGAEYRIFEKEFMPEFFNLGYEVERVVWDEDLGAYVPKSAHLLGLPKAQGYYVDAGLTLANLLDIYAAYQQMNYGETEGGDTVPNKTFYARASIDATPIPKLGMAEAYYQQPQADNIFDTKSDGTTLGYKLGFEMSPGLMLVYDQKTIYRNGEPNRIMSVETVFTF